MDWQAAMSSEIFREYVKNELLKEANEKPEPQIDKDHILSEFDKFTQKVNSNPTLKYAFSILKEKLAKDPKYRDKVHPDLVNGIAMLFIHNDKESK